jgi:isopentenyldiphosphate isomerase
MKFEHPRKAFCQWYLSQCEWPAEKFILQPEEVEKVKWVENDELIRDVRENPDKYVPSMHLILERLYS